MALGFKLQKLMGKIYPPNSRIDRNFKGNDITFITNEAGEPVRLYIGRRKDNGNIAGERYVRTLKRAEDGTVIKDHWDCKGRSV